MRSKRVSAARAAALAALTALPASAAPIPHDVVVNVDDRGFDPPSVAVQLGGSVTWVERGINVHTATTLGGAPQAVSTGGFGSFESRSLTFLTPGTYPYTSSTDCLNGNSMPGFTCGVYYVVVVAPGEAAPALPVGSQPGGAAAPGTQPAAAAAPVGTNQVTITDSGITPRSIKVPAGASVIWTNSGGHVHSATSDGSGPLPFDSGGLGPGQSGQAVFPIAGTYGYSSAPECLNGNHAPGYDCGPYTIVVTGS